jgi:hypothetical protein
MNEEQNDNDNKTWFVSFGWKHAGLITIFYRDRWGVHLFPKWSHWVWGYDEEWYDGLYYSWGLGPIILIVHST